jgi:hypothetical protein
MALDTNTDLVSNPVAPAAPAREVVTWPRLF